MSSFQGPAGQRTLKVVMTFLEMAGPPRRAHRPAPLKQLAVLRAHEPSLSFYRYLYNTIGAPWHWTDRRLMGDGELAAIIGDEKVEIYVLYVGGVPAGFVELDFRQSPRVELTAFGLMPEFNGQGLGRYLLQWALDAAWRPETELVTVKTTTADHPRALGMYQKAGFAVVDRADAYLAPIADVSVRPAAAPEQDD
jgi:GNAT superfamily N-acetyltransferase